MDKVIEIEEVSVKPTPVENTPKKDVKHSKVDVIREEPETIESKKVAEYNYTVIRFSNPSPPLVGIDGINYGPFQENDIANIPFKNAKILIYEKLAEEIDFS